MAVEVNIENCQISSLQAYKTTKPKKQETQETEKKKHKIAGRNSLFDPNRLTETDPKLKNTTKNENKDLEEMLQEVGG